LRAVLRHEPESLTQTIRLAIHRSDKTDTVRTHSHIAVFDACDAYHAQKALQHRINSALMRKGVSMLDPEFTYISPYSTIGTGTTILPGSMIRPGSTVGSGCTIGPNTILDRAHIGDGTSVNSSQVYESSIGSNATVGPFAYIRPGCMVGNDTRIGDFVELKKAEIGNGTKVSHLTYIGDASVGERVNFGCGTVIVNYDGYTKSKTVIGDDCFIGCNTNLVAPVTLGDRVLTAAGTTVTKDVPDGALAVARARQETKEGWNDRRRKLHGQDT
jgi:UDP-N-acetylglucosamine diphosphorylase/glucosamine-1-phosphate N-acetyltransferase